MSYAKSPAPRLNFLKIILYICSVLHKFTVMRYTIFILLSFILLSCRSYDANRVLQDVDNYIMTRPDSALTVLEGVERRALRTERQRAHHALLYAMALDKNYIDVSEDSIAGVAVDYYSRKGPMKYRARAYYYHGLAYYYQQDYDRAILEFTKAEKAAEVSDSLYWGMTRSFQADVYNRTYNDIEEIKCLLDAKKIYSELYDNYKVQTVNLRLAKAYSNSFEYQKSDSLFRDLINSQDADSLIYIYALNGYAFLKATQSDLQSDVIHAVNIFDQVVADNSDCMTTQDYWAYAYALNVTGRSKESAEMVNQLISIDTTSSTPYWLYRIAKYNNNLREALKYLEESNSRDSDIETDILNQAIALVQRDYYESESELAEYKAKGRTFALISVIIIFVLILVLGYFTVSRYVRKQNDDKDRYISYADEVSRQLKALQTEADAMPALKRKYIELYKEKFESLRVLCDNYLLYQDRTDAEKKMYSRVVAMINEVRGDKNCIGELESILDKDLDGLMTALRSEIKAKEVDYSIYAYSIIGFDATTISNLLDLSINQVYIRKSRIKRHIENSDSENKARFLEMLS